MDFDKLTTDQLLELIPTQQQDQTREDDRWECKSGIYLAPAKKNELKKELGKQVSAFANSGGGFLLFGLSKERVWEPCVDTVGREPMSDVLDRLVEQSVDQPIRSFRVYRIPFTGDKSKGAYLIHIQDSPAAPHQAKEERQYYYRIGAHSLPAPHFHLELLRNRFTKSVLQIMDVTGVPKDADLNTGVIGVEVQVRIKNISRQATTAWGVLVRNLTENEAWTIPGGGMKDGEMFSQGSSVILPGETRLLTFYIRAGIGKFTATATPLVGLWQQVALELYPVSNNHTGAQYILGQWSNEKWRESYGRFDQELQQVLSRNINR
ncbi:Divergent AAA domain protein [Anatilimnocola aggregata]|uniref:Divergent AAA domain protein n=1 Tax=Anatilimnocola aggregata TaxID=2528021 RepID=A0A517Y6P3_9BACT|nr:ATP-binding protein [Anatilimnocola aggregata]QDU25802.1 Divergent AAA domain protein [Anatilimnocola aggregata]